MTRSQRMWRTVRMAHRIAPSGQTKEDKYKNFTLAVDGNSSKGSED